MAVPSLNGEHAIGHQTQQGRNENVILATGELYGLTWRERDVLALLVQRQTNAEIAESLFVSPRTIEAHVASILAKLGAANRREAGARTLRIGSN